MYKKSRSTDFHQISVSSRLRPPTVSPRSHLNQILESRKLGMSMSFFPSLSSLHQKVKYTSYDCQHSNAHYERYNNSSRVLWTVCQAYCCTRIYGGSLEIFLFAVDTCVVDGKSTCEKTQKLSGMYF